MSDTRFPKVNVLQIVLNFFSIVIPVGVALLVWGSSVEKRITRLEERSITYVNNEVISKLITDIEWMKDGQTELKVKQQEILQALNKFASELRNR